VIWTARVMRGVNDRRRAGIETAQGRQQIADVHVLGTIELAECVVGRIDIGVEGLDIRHQPAQGSLPCVPVSIDQARQHDRIAGIDDLGIVGLKVRSDRRNPGALDQYVGLGEITQMRIKGKTLPPRNSVRPIETTDKVKPP
jgi:hypothetical protein